VGRTRENGGSEDFALQFAVEIWSQAGNCMAFSTSIEEKVYIAVAHIYLLIIL